MARKVSARIYYHLATGYFSLWVKALNGWAFSRVTKKGRFFKSGYGFGANFNKAKAQARKHNKAIPANGWTRKTIKHENTLIGFRDKIKEIFKT